MQNATGSGPSQPGPELKPENGWEAAHASARALNGALKVMGEVFRIASESKAADGLDYLHNYLVGLRYLDDDEELVNYRLWVERGRP
jgi:hypothetical protein